MWRINVLIPLTFLLSFLKSAQLVFIMTGVADVGTVRLRHVGASQAGTPHTALAGYVHAARHASPPRAGIRGCAGCPDRTQNYSDLRTPPICGRYSHPAFLYS